MKTKEQEYIETMTYAPCNRTRTIEKIKYQSTTKNKFKHKQQNSKRRTMNEQSRTNNQKQMTTNENNYKGQRTRTRSKRKTTNKGK